MYRLLSILPFVLFLQACGESHNINLIKDGIMDFDKTLTVGEAFDNWKECTQVKKWETFQSDNGRKVVQFQCDVANIENFMSSFRSALAKSECSESCPHLEIVKEERVFQWTLNKDDTFQISYAGNNFKWKDGKETSIAAGIDSIKNVYSNEISYSLDEVPSEMGAMILSNMLKDVYQNAKGGNKALQIPPPVSEQEKLEEPVNKIAEVTTAMPISISELAGSYIMEDDATQLRLNVQHPDSEGNVKAEIFVANERCDGSAEGLATLENNELIFSESDSDQNKCTIRIKFIENQAVSTEEGCDQFHGISCSFSGEMTKS